MTIISSYLAIKFFQKIEKLSLFFEKQPEKRVKIRRYCMGLAKKDEGR